MIPGLLLVLAAGMAWLQFYVRRRLRFAATHFVRVGADVNSLPPVERWTLAVVARYLMPMEFPVDSFRPPEPRRVPALQSMLVRDWGVRDRAGLLRTIRHLQATGHRVRCAQATGRPESNFLAWDLLRVILLAWAGLHLDWLSRPEFLQIVADSGSQVQRRFSDWQEAVASYEAGLAVWTTDGKVRKLADRAHLTFQTLLQDPGSPWKTTDWRTPLVDTIAA